MTTLAEQLDRLNHTSVGGRNITKQVTFNRPAATTQYSAKDCVNVDVPITGASHATPIVLTAVAHGLADGDPITITNVGGNTNANASCFAKVTGYTANTLALYSDKALTTAIVGNADLRNGYLFAVAIVRREHEIGRAQQFVDVGLL